MKKCKDGWCGSDICELPLLGANNTYAQVQLHGAWRLAGKARVTTQQLLPQSYARGRGSVDVHGTGSQRQVGLVTARKHTLEQVM